MNKLNSLKDSFLENNDSNEVNKKDNEINKKIEKILCNHCGRTTGNGIRCKGMCVADNNY